MFYPFRDERELTVGQPSSYSSKLNEPGVIEVINNNKSLVEPYSDLVNYSFVNYRSDNNCKLNFFSMYFVRTNEEIHLSFKNSKK